MLFNSLHDLKLQQFISEFSCVCKSMRIKMRSFPIASILLLFVVNAFPLNDPSCSLDPPYKVYEFSKVITELLESIPQINCDGLPVEEIVRFNCKSRCVKATLFAKMFSF